MMQARLHHNCTTVLVEPSDWLDQIKNLGARGVIFDCDGTLVESTQAHFLAMQSAVQKQGFEMALDWYNVRAGLDRRAIFHQLKEDGAADLDEEAAIDASIALFERYVDQISPIPPTADLLRELSKQGYPVAVATNSERDVATLSLRQAGLLDIIDALVCISDEFPPKPNPHMFEHASWLLELPAHQVVVFEDSPQGVQAALSAKMTVFEILSD